MHVQMNNDNFYVFMVFFLDIIISTIPNVYVYTHIWL